MTDSIRTFRVSPEKITFEYKEAARLLGYKGRAPDSVVQTLEALWAAAKDHIAAQCGYRLIRTGLAVEAGQITCGQVVLECGPLIGRHLKGSTGLACFVATLGPDFDRWSRHFFEAEQDPYLGYLSDTLGSVAVESVVDWMETQLQAEIEPLQWSRSNRVSPGYCHWDVSQQHRLFALLPEGFCGIHLMESSLMVPIKSVSGVIGMGPGLRRLDYGCHLCPMERCIMRRT